MDQKQAGLGSLLLAGSGGILTATGTAGGLVLLVAGALSLVATAAHSVREAVAGRGR
jgi:hypothetical protein